MLEFNIKFAIDENLVGVTADINQDGELGPSREREAGNTFYFIFPASLIGIANHSVLTGPCVEMKGYVTSFLLPILQVYMKPEGIQKEKMDVYKFCVNNGIGACYMKKRAYELF